MRAPTCTRSARSAGNPEAYAKSDELDGVGRPARRAGAGAAPEHSTQCPISAAALEEVEAWGGDFVYLDLLAHRDVSNAIAAKLNVRHESPQAIVLKAGRAEAVLNQDDITRDALSRLVTK